MIVRQIVCNLLKSNSYLISNSEGGPFWFIDFGDFSEEQIFPFKFSDISGVLLTHTHYDHISGLKGLLKQNPGVLIYTSVFGKTALSSDRLNYSKYYSEPFSYTGENIRVLFEGDTVTLFTGVELAVMETPGHDPGCLTFQVGDYLFTGDSFIPGYKIQTGLREADTNQAIISEKRIKERILNNTVVCPGHHEISRSSNR